MNSASGRFTPRAGGLNIAGQLRTSQRQSGWRLRGHYGLDRYGIRACTGASLPGGLKGGHRHGVNNVAEIAIGHDAD